MLPPVPNQKFIDAHTPADLQAGGKRIAMKERQKSDYEAEFILYRALEGLSNELSESDNQPYPALSNRIQPYPGIIVLHNVGYKKKTAELFVEEKATDGEHDFVVIVKNQAVVIFEVKQPQNDHASFVRSLKKAKDQLWKATELVRAIGFKCKEKNLTILRFSCFPTQERGKHETETEEVLFKDDITRFRTWWQINVARRIEDCASSMLRTEFTLVGLWYQGLQGVDKYFTLPAAIHSINEKLKKQKITMNPDKPTSKSVMGAPLVFQYLGIKCITTEQANCFAKNRLLVKGPAGSGKSILIQAKVISIAHTKQCVLILPYEDAARQYMNVFETASLTVKEIRLPNSSFKDAFLASEEQVIILTYAWKAILNHVRNDEVNGFKWAEKALKFLGDQDFHLFLDDFQDIFWMARQEWTLTKTVTESFIKLLLIQPTNRVVWIALDPIQQIQLNYDLLYFQCVKQLLDHILQTCCRLLIPVENLLHDLRNSHEICTLLGKVRGMLTDLYKDIPTQISSEFPSSHDKLAPKPGHYIHGPKPHLHLVLEKEDKCWGQATKILEHEFQMLFGMQEKQLKPEEVAVIPVMQYGSLLHERLHKKGSDEWESFKSRHKDMITEVVKESYPFPRKNHHSEYGYLFSDSVHYGYSLEFAAVVVIADMTSNREDEEAFLEDKETWRMAQMNILSRLYLAISRAKVYCSVILLCKDGSPSKGMLYVLEALKDHFIVE